MKIGSIVSRMKYSEANISKLESIGEFVQYSADKVDEDKLIEMVQEVDYLILGASGVKHFSKKVFDSANSLKVISMLGSGVDVIDLNAAKDSEVLITNAKGANAQSVAEHIFGVALNLSKRVTESHVGLQNQGSNFKHFKGVELYGKRIGIVGFGEIGSRVATIAQGFNMDVIYHKRDEHPSTEYRYVSLDELLSEADLIVIAVPGNSSTVNLIDKNLLAKMKATAILVSISRESVINEEAILEMLESDKIFGYGCDADINQKPNPQFYKYPNVIITPHTAFFTSESEVNVENTAVENIIKFHEGNPQNVVTS